MSKIDKRVQTCSLCGIAEKVGPTKKQPRRQSVDFYECFDGLRGCCKSL